jgi:5'-nucleotidase (lipoprotein e(P4) family)
MQLNTSRRILGAVLFAAVTCSGAFAQTRTPAADLDYQTAAVLCMQKAAEYRALAYQAFNIARLRLDEDFEKKNLKKLPKAERKRPRAIIVDIDETVLDNSPAQARSINTGLAFNQEDWYGWGEMRKAKAIPGAVDFLNYARVEGREGVLRLQPRRGAKSRDDRQLDQGRISRCLGRECDAPHERIEQRRTPRRGRGEISDRNADWRQS